MIVLDLRGYTFNTKEDFLFYIHHLIIGIVKNLDIYTKHIDELGELIEERNLIERPKRVVSAEIYDKFNAMLGNSTSNLSNYFGDAADFGSSYRNYRRYIKKKSEKLEIGYVEFTQEQEEELNKVTTARNWGNHIPVSLIHSTMRKAFEEKIDTSKPIFPAYFEKYQGMWLVSLYEQNYKILQSYKELFELLKKDYEALTGNPCLISKVFHEVRDISDLQIPEISYGIQTKKIKTVEDIKAHYTKE